MIEIKLAYYRKEDWEELMELIDDRDSMHDSWKEWHQAYVRGRKKLKSQGFEVVDVEVDLRELQIYCAFRGIENDGKARSQFVQQK